MKKAIEFLRSQNIQVSEWGKILSALPEGEEGLTLINYLEDFTSIWPDTGEGYCFTVIKNQLATIEI